MLGFEPAAGNAILIFRPEKLPEYDNHASGVSRRVPANHWTAGGAAA